MIFWLRNECLCFLGSWGTNRSAGQTNRVNYEAVLGVICLFRATIHTPWTQKKRHSFLILTMFPIRTLSKIFREKLLIQNTHGNGYLTAFDVLITAHVIRPNRRTFCWLCSSGIELKKFSRVQRRKYDTIVNIYYWTAYILYVRRPIMKLSMDDNDISSENCCRIILLYIQKNFEYPNSTLRYCG